MMTIPTTPPKRRGLAATSLRCAAGLLLLATAGCGNAWFGESETILPGDRISIRSVPDSQAPVTPARVSLPRARQLSAWPQAGGEATRAPGRLQGTLALDRIWSRSIGAGSDSESRVVAEPIYAAGRVYALDAAARVTAVDAASGDVAWRLDMAPDNEGGRDGFGGGLAYDQGVLVVANGFGHVLGLNPGDGTEVWRFEASSPFRAAPAIARGTAVVMPRDGSVIALDLRTGAQKWRASNVEGGATMLTSSGPAISGEVVAAPLSSGDIALFRLSDGRRGWSEALGAPRRGSAMSLITDVSAAPVMAGGKIVAGGVSGRLVAFDIPSGRRLWARDFGAYNRAWVAGGLVYALSDDAVLHALSLNNGRSLWRRQLPIYDDPENRADPFAYGGPILVGDALYVTSSEERIFAIDAVTGEIAAEVDLPDASSIPPIFADGRMFVLDETGDLHAYR